MKQSVITIGTFDGVHKGHQAILDKLVKTAKDEKLKSIVISFEKPVKSVSGLITTSKEKVDILSSFAIDEILFLPINKSIISLSADEFFDNILVKQLKVKHIVVGYDCAFGKDRTGNIAWLKEKVKRYNISLDVINSVKVDKQIVSSSKIRNLIKQSKISDVNKMLNRPFSFSGKHVSGNKIGRELGFPTINIKTDDKKLLPKGVFVCSLSDAKGQLYPGVLNIGVRPTIDLKEHNLSVEVHLLNYSSVWKTKNIKVYIYKYIRNEKKFEDISSLKKTIQKDISGAFSFFNIKYVKID